MEKSLKHYWPIMDELVMVNDITMKGRRLMILFLFQRQIVRQLHSNHMDIGKMRFLVGELVYWLKMIQTSKHYSGVPHAWNISRHNHIRGQCKHWEVVGADIFFVKNKRLLCNVDYYSMYPLIENKQQSYR